mmetsp:Transcript_18171/g.40868  ORF Transcript_18171/g.40868 Transcript_18171/m.40868 type:complete len:1145 (-) Transcript_18171:316-3750(-)
MASTKKQMATLEKVLMSIRSNCDAKLESLEEQYTGDQEWLKTTIANTKSNKDALGLVCPPTARKVASKRNASRFVQDDDDKENSVNESAKPSRSTRAKSHAVAPEKKEKAADDMSVFDPEPADPSEPPAKKKGGRAKKSTVPKLAAPAAQAPQERDPSPDPAPKRGAAAKKEALAAAGESGSFRPDKAPIQKMLVPAIQAELIKRNHSKTGKKEDLVLRLAAAMELENAVKGNILDTPRYVGQDISPVVGMRVVHYTRDEHNSSRGLPGTIEIIPGRGAMRAEEQSASVRWDSDTSDVRGPYYTGENCDRGSGIGLPKYDLICIDALVQGADTATAALLPVAPELEDVRMSEDPAFPEPAQQDPPAADAMEVEAAVAAEQAEKEDDDDEAEEEASAAQNAELQKRAQEEFAKAIEAERLKFEAEMQEAVEQQEKLKGELKAKQEEERRKLEEEMQRDAQAFEEAMKQEQTKRFADLAEKKKVMEEEMSRASQNLSAEERGKMISQHEDDMKKLEQETEGKKEAMDKDLQAKLAMRKKKRKQQQQKEQGAELAKLDEGLKENEEEAKQRLKAKELEALVKMALEEDDPDKAVVLLRKRHQTEEDELRASQSAHYALSMAALPEAPGGPGKEAAAVRAAVAADNAIVEQELQAVADLALADLHEHQKTEIDSILNAEVALQRTESDDAMEIQKRITEEKNAKIAALRAIEQREREKMDAEIKKMEEEMEELRQKEKEALDVRRTALKSRGMDNLSRIETELDQVRSATFEDDEDLIPQTQEGIQRQSEVEHDTLRAALGVEKERQQGVLEKKLEARRRGRMVEIESTFKKHLEDSLGKLKEGVAMAEMSATLGKVSAEDRAKLIAAGWATQTESKESRVASLVQKAGNKWLTKALKREPVNVASVGVSKYQAALEKHTVLSPASRYEATLVATRSTALSKKKSVYDRRTSQHDSNTSSPAATSRSSGGMDVVSKLREQQLRDQLEEQKLQSADQQRAMQAHLQALEARLKEQEFASARGPIAPRGQDPEASGKDGQDPEASRPATTAGTGEAAPPTAGSGVSAESFAQMLRESPLASKLDEVEGLLRKLLENALAPPAPPGGDGQAKSVAPAAAAKSPPAPAAAAKGSSAAAAPPAKKTTAGRPKV